jgi:hypothetical protein
MDKRYFNRIHGNAIKYIHLYGVPLMRNYEPNILYDS